MIYRVEYSGFAEVEAESPEEAEEMFWNGYHTYDEEWINDVTIQEE